MKRKVIRVKKRRQRANTPETSPAVRNQLARLFGSGSAEATLPRRSTRQWRRTLQAVLRELERYRRATVRSDQLHELALSLALSSSHDALKTDDFWPGYAEGITRFALLLMGDYPDHHARKRGKRRSDHYDLRLHRTLFYSQDDQQKKRTLFAAWRILRLPKSFDEVIGEFRDQHGYSASDGDFIRWLKRTYPAAYAAVF